MLTRSTRTAAVRRSRIAQISDDVFSLSHTCCFDSGRCLSSSCLRIVSCIPRCVPVQKAPIKHGELRRLDIPPSNQTFQGLFYGCRRCGFPCCRCDTFWSEQGQRLAVVISIGSGESVETSPGFGSQGVPRTFCSSLWSYRCSSGTRLTD